MSRSWAVGSLFPVDPSQAKLLTGQDRLAAESRIAKNHYTRSIPSGKSHYIGFRDAVVVFSIPANPYIAEFCLGWPGSAWELSRLWAPDGHDKNLLTQAISRAVGIIKEIENPDILISYADPNVGHHGGVYRAASWLHQGRSEESRGYKNTSGKVVARRAFHSGGHSMTKAEIEANGYSEITLIGKERFVKPISRRAKKSILEGK